MIDEYFYVYPIEKIKEIFPELDPDTTNLQRDCGIRGGWNPDMTSATDKIYKIERYLTDHSAVKLIDNLWTFDLRIGKKLTISTEISDGYYFLNKADEFSYVISPTVTKDTIGTIVSMPYRKRKNTMHKIVSRMTKRSGNVQQNACRK